MAFETHPLTPERFEDFADVINPNRRETHCWCLSHRLPAREIEALGQGSREQAMRCLTAGPDGADGTAGNTGNAGNTERPGVVTYLDGRPVGWCHIAPRAEIPRLVGSTRIRPVDDVAVWSIICVVVRSGHRKQGVSAALIDGAVSYAASRGAPAVEAYPVDPPGRMDLTMAFVGTKKMFDRAGFRVIGETDAVASKMPRLVMRRDLDPGGPDV